MLTREEYLDQLKVVDGVVGDWEFTPCAKELADHDAEQRKVIENLQKQLADVVPRSRYNVCNQDWLNALAELEKVRVIAKEEIEQQAQEIARLTQSYKTASTWHDEATQEIVRLNEELNIDLPANEKAFVEDMTRRLRIGCQYTKSDCHRVLKLVRRKHFEARQLKQTIQTLRHTVEELLARFGEQNYPEVQQAQRVLEETR